VRLTLAARDVADLLGIEAGTKLMQLDRVMLSVDQAPIEWRSISCHMREEYYLAEVA
jgi:DNA-binding GntR family transcriptional regulator